MSIITSSIVRLRALFLSPLAVFLYLQLALHAPLLANNEQILKLDECIRIGVSQNLQIISDQLAPKEKKLEIDVAKRIFIPALKAGFRGSKKSRTGLGYDYSLEKKIRNGTTLGLDLSGQSYSTSDQDNSRSATFSLNRPLLQNFGKQVTGLDIDIKTIEYDISLELFKHELNQFIQEISGLYFELYFARENLRIQEQALERAQKQFSDTQNDIEKGVLPEQEIYLVEENVVRFEIKKESAIRDIAYYELSLKRLMCLEDPEEVSFIASDSFQDCLKETIEFVESKEKIFTNNPGYKIKNLALQKARLDQDYYRNQLLPVLDLQANYTVSRRDASRRQDEYAVGLVYEVPLSSRSDRAMFEKSKIAIRRNELSIGDVEFNLAYDLRKLLLDITYQRKVLEAKGRATRLAEKKLENESEKYKNGISTLADIVRFQRELEDTTIEELRTIVLLNKFRIQKLLLEGVLYQAYGIEIAQ
ncbi:MAG: TolC family protein [Candidatus Riflebacteria bacterium]